MSQASHGRLCQANRCYTGCCSELRAVADKLADIHVTIVDMKLERTNERLHDKRLEDLAFT